MVVYVYSYDSSVIWRVPKIEIPGGWMVYNGKSHPEMDDDWGYPSCRKPAG